ncbi:hypothetical protein GOP47_0023945 [Adiantum capillus-veneris]|uniref:Uncharacterized protein n=1 Tax=Adiantum capillus-veneris TaxID=13818 RepID=A0A9D4U5H1_ADICA|nr:hypothetical protein GOP47_0023945 [Adiantum capillus-veneris]
MGKRKASSPPLITSTMKLQERVLRDLSAFLGVLPFSESQHISSLSLTPSTTHNARPSSLAHVPPSPTHIDLCYDASPAHSSAPLSSNTLTTSANGISQYFSRTPQSLAPIFTTSYHHPTLPIELAHYTSLHPPPTTLSITITFTTLASPSPSLTTYLD